MSTKRNAVTVTIILTACLAAKLSSSAQVPGDRTRTIQDRMTPQQRQNGRVIGEEFKSSSRLLDLKVNVDTHRDGTSGPTAKEASQVVAEAACASDAAFVGRVLSAQSFPTEDGTFLFTDYQVRVSQTYRNRNAPDIRPGGIVTVTRPGGELLVDSALVHARVNTLPPLETANQYLFVGPVVPDSHSILTKQRTSVFSVHGGRLVSLAWFDTKEAKVTTEGLDSDEFLRTLRRLSCR